MSEKNSDPVFSERAYFPGFCLMFAGATLTIIGLGTEFAHFSEVPLSTGLVCLVGGPLLLGCLPLLRRPLYTFVFMIGTAVVSISSIVLGLADVLNLLGLMHAANSAKTSGLEVVLLFVVGVAGLAAFHIYLTVFTRRR